MKKLKNKKNTERCWLDWCRLCANDDASINVRQKDVYMRIISKCFDIEIGLEEPQLGGMLCSECYALIGDLLNFAENVNKVQPIFELLRHTEPNEQVDVCALRQQYGLQDKSSQDHSYKTEPEELEELSSREDSLDGDSEIFYQDVDSDPQHDLTISPIPARRKRGRPKGSRKLQHDEAAESNEHQETLENFKIEASVDFHEDRSSSHEEGVEQELVQNHIWLEDYSMEENKTTLNSDIKRKRGRPKQSVKTEVLDEWEVSEEDLDFLTPTFKRKSTDEPNQLIAKDQSADRDELFNPNESAQSTSKRKRGRPRKHESIILHDKSDSKCKNVALARLLLASPVPEAETEAAGSVRNSNLTENQIRKNPVTCNVCHKELSSENGLKYHIERVHMKKKPFVCDVCGKRVRTVSELKEHMLVHTEDRPFVCPLCNAAFKNRKRLNIHSQTHGEPSYECEICGKKLQTRAIWNKHKSVHTNERRFKCSICGTATKNSTALKIHLLSHTGLRPYTCKYCNKDFASGANCRDHKIRKHPIEYEEDDDKSCRIQSVPTLDELRALAAGMEKGERLRKPKTMKIE
ncbi:zinc finger protein weckle-like [Drosophila montana]|uniref:zinc finger protein weckle-like n=1 Tax=Drosophila montana TaxID=40370 RepID=UPI00313A9587